MRLRTLTAIGLVLGLGACSTFGPDNLPLYGNYEDIDNRSLCLGMMAFAADFPQAVWPGQSKSYYSSRKSDLGTKSAALYKIAVKKYGKQDAAERGITGYSSAKSLAYVLGGGAVQEALDRCEPTVAEALEVDSDYQNFLNHLGEKPVNPVVSDIVPQPVEQKESITAKNTTIIEVDDATSNSNVIEIGGVSTTTENKVRRYTPDHIPPGIKIFSKSSSDNDLIAPMKDVFDEDISANDLNAKWRKENMK